MPISAPKKCYYETLSVEQSATPVEIKKAHRKLALRFHPDKLVHLEESERIEKTEEFRRIQEAYECLSDAKERKWYDEHRTAILSGALDSEGGAGDGDGIDAYIIPVTKFHSTFCYTDINDEGPEGFFAVYSKLFEDVDEGELRGFLAEGNIDYHADYPRPKFGSIKTEWGEVSLFYAVWESFSSWLNFSWEDEYDVREAPNRQYKRAMEDANKKSRKTAKKERNAEVCSLVEFVKKRDPRVKNRALQVEREKQKKAKDAVKDQKRRKQEAAAAREAWRAEAELRMAEEQANDLIEGRVRLADLEDDYDYGGGGKKKGKKKKKKKAAWSSDEEEQEQQDEQATLTTTTTTTHEAATECDKDKDSEEIYNNNIGDQSSSTIMKDLESDLGDHHINDDERDEEELLDHEEELCSEEEEEEEPDFYRCEICRKDFKSKGQLENHIKSKKHKEAVKKYEKKQRQ